MDPFDDVLICPAIRQHQMIANHTGGSSSSSRKRCVVRAAHLASRSGLVELHLHSVQRLVGRGGIIRKWGKGNGGDERVVRARFSLQMMLDTRKSVLDRGRAGSAHQPSRVVPIVIFDTKQVGDTSNLARTLRDLLLSR